MLGYVFVYVCACVSIRSDVRLHKDDVDICFSKTLNSCKVPQIRYASVERLLERLTDLRFLSIDFLNTFLHTYRIFTTATVVMDKLADIYKKPFSSIPIRSYRSHMQMSSHKHRQGNSLYWFQRHKIFLQTCANLFVPIFVPLQTQIHTIVHIAITWVF